MRIKVRIFERCKYNFNGKYRNLSRIKQINIELNFDFDKKMEEKTIHSRIQELVNKFANGKNTLFASLIGTNEANIRGYTKKVIPKQDILERIVRSFDIDSRWLLTGEGQMLKKKVQESPDDIENNKLVGVHTDNPREGIPLIPVDAMAGALIGEQTVLEYECERYVVPAFKGADFLIPVKGLSMYPHYNSGDIVACQRVPLGDLFFQWNKVYVIDTRQGALIKRIKPGSDKLHILIVSDNKEYDPFELPYTAINAVALVIGVIRLE